MKLLRSAILILLITTVLSCKKDKDESPFFPAELALVLNDLGIAFDSLNNSISAGVSQFAASGIEDNAMRAKLLELYQNSTFSTEFVFTSPEGIMEIIEPEEYYSYEGFDISSQPHVIKAFQTRQPALSDAFTVVEGYQAAVTIHPIVQGNTLLGAISAVIMPETVLGRIIMPYLQNQDFEMWVMEKSGMTLWDQDEEEIGLNLFTDPIYQDFPELLVAAQKIADGESGETSYSFYQAGMEQIVTKKTYWDTFHIQGNEWKIIWVLPQ